MANKKGKYTKSQRKAVEKAVKKAPKWVIIVAIVLVVVLAVVGVIIYLRKDKKNPLPIVGELSFHFLTLGNSHSGDCIYVKAGNNDILIDAGSTGESVPTIKSYVDKYVTDNTLEYVIATHAHEDHISGFAVKNNIFSNYKCKTIIDFPRTHKENKDTTTYGKYVKNRDKEVTEDGATHYTALECVNKQNGATDVYQLSDSVSMQILYNYYYENDTPKNDDENNYSVILQFMHGDRKFLLTGDLEKEGEEKLVDYYSGKNVLSQVELFKAGHHGSYTASNDCLLKVIKPKVCVVTCVADNTEYTDEQANTFPSQKFINRISGYTDKVYVTTLGSFLDKNFFSDLNGNVVVASTESEVKVNCSNNSTLLKDSSWFKINRSCPSSWAS